MRILVVKGRETMEVNIDWPEDISDLDKIRTLEALILDIKKTTKEANIPVKEII